LTYDPADPTPSVGGPAAGGPREQADNRAVEARDDVLVFTGPVLPHDVDVVGHARARVHVRPELEHADLFVRLCDVGPDGVSRNVVDGVRRLDPRSVPPPTFPSARTASSPSTWSCSRPPTGSAPGTGCGCRSPAARSPGSPATPAPASRSRRRRPDGPCRFEVFHDAAHPSRLELPVLS
jgi:predicted acyl esterase